MVGGISFFEIVRCFFGLSRGLGVGLMLERVFGVSSGEVIEKLLVT